MASDDMNIQLFKNIKTGEFEKFDNSMFTLTCCGAAISKDLNYILIGDFNGMVRVFALFEG